MIEIHRLFSKKFMALTILAATGVIMAGMLLPSTPVFSQGMLARMSLSGENAQAQPNLLIVQDTSRGRMEDFSISLAQLSAEKEKKLTFAVPASFEGQTIYDVALANNEKVIALTFDDGPWPKYTEQVLNILKENNIKATFFLIGQHLKAHPEIGKKVVEEGHAIANHTWNHHYHPVSQAIAAKELGDTAALIYELTGVKTSLFRPPGGVLTNGLVAYAHSQNYLVAMWSSDAQESSYPSTQTLINNVLTTARPGGIVLMHDGGGDRSTTVKALPTIIAELRNQGYRFVTLTELLEIYDTQQQTPIAENTDTPPTPLPDPIN
nr:polysaccharide deacetylase family protein [Phormidium sp. CCY1219]